MTVEQLFSRQEQAVVYLFSRYWDKIDGFRNKRICRIHTHFPDFTLADTSSRLEEALEFEFALSDFDSHIPKDLRKLRKNGIRRLYVVYWDDNRDTEEMKGRIAEYFDGEIVLLCLKDYFSPCATAGPDHLEPSWQFCQEQPALHEAYPMGSMTQEVERLAAEGNLKRRKPDPELYRVSGYSTVAADSIDLDHWKLIHLYLTRRCCEDNVPSRLFLRPNGCQWFSGCFEVADAFTVAKGGDPVRDFFRQYYFFAYEGNFKNRFTCLVYARFTELTREQGRRLYILLKGEDFDLRRSQELVRGKVRRAVERIIERDRRPLRHAPAALP